MRRSLPLAILLLAASAIVGAAAETMCRGS